MPRKDGLDTNQEMLLDFKRRAQEVFVSAYEREFEGKLPEAYIGKPLDALSVEVYQNLRGFAAEEDSIRWQSLAIRPLTVDDAAFMRERHPTMRDYPEHVHRVYGNLAKKIGSTALDNTLVMDSLVSVRGIVADYTAGLSGQMCHVGTLKEEPAERNLALGKTFADEAASYIGSLDYEMNRNFGGVAVAGNTELRFNVQMRPNLPLNGHESRKWLTAYANSMQEKMVRVESRVERLMSLEAPNSIIESEQLRHDEIAAALRRAEELLERK